MVLYCRFLFVHSVLNNIHDTAAITYIWPTTNHQSTPFSFVFVCFADHLLDNQYPTLYVHGFHIIGHKKHRQRIVFARCAFYVTGDVEQTMHFESEEKNFAQCCRNYARIGLSRRCGHWRAQLRTQLHSTGHLVQATHKDWLNRGQCKRVTSTQTSVSGRKCGDT